MSSGETGNAASGERVSHRQKFGEVEGIVLTGHDDKIQSIFGQEFHDGRRGGVLQKSAENGFTALQLFSQDSSGAGQWHVWVPEEAGRDEVRIEVV